MRGMGRLRQLAGKISPAAGVLLYHRIADAETDPQLLCVTPKHFAEHLEVIRRFYRPLALPKLSSHLRSGLLRSRSLALTFDDGYADNFLHAKPLLDRSGIPATVFVTAGQVGSAEEFWWDELERILLTTPQLPATLALTWADQTRTWDLGVAPLLTTPDAQQWHVELPEAPSRRHQVYRELAPLVRTLDIQARQSVLNDLRTWAGLGIAGRPANRAMTAAELAQLGAGGGMEVGAHTLNHPCLAALPAPEQEAEIRGSKARLEELLGQPVVSFAYPYGAKKDYTSTTVHIAQQAGFRCACSNFPGRVGWGTDRYQLPRLLVRNWDGDQFARRLHDWFAGH